MTSSPSQLRIGIESHRRVRVIDALTVIICTALLLAATTHEAAAQYIQFSSKGQTNNFDSLYNDYTSKHKPRLNSTLFRHKYDSGAGQLNQYRGKYDQSVGNKLNRYNGKYDSAFGRIQQYRTKYEELGQQFDDRKLPPGFSKFNDRYSLNQRFQKIAPHASRAASIRDQLLAGKFKLDSNTVLNNRMMQSYMDSLRKTLPPKPVNPFEETPKELLVKELNERMHDQADSLRDSTKWIGEAKKKKEWVDLNYASLKSEDGSDLKPMAVSMVKTRLLKSIDSSRLENLKATRLKMEETERKGWQKLAKFREKESFWQKSYLEGIMSMAANQSGTFQVSPAWAYHIIPSWSLGGGPNITVSKKETSGVKLDVGARFLTKYEILHRIVYFQVEDRVNPSAVGKENKLFTQHAFMGGAGCVIPFFSPITLNVAAMYQFYTNGEAQNDGSPWVFRIGFSTNKKSK